MDWGGGGWRDRCFPHCQCRRLETRSGVRCFRRILCCFDFTTLLLWHFGQVVTAGCKQMGFRLGLHAITGGCRIVFFVDKGRSHMWWSFFHCLIWFVSKSTAATNFSQILYVSFYFVLLPIMCISFVTNLIQPCLFLSTSNSWLRNSWLRNNAEHPQTGT